MVRGVGADLDPLLKASSCWRWWRVPRSGIAGVLGGLASFCGPASAATAYPLRGGAPRPCSGPSRGPPRAAAVTLASTVEGVPVAPPGLSTRADAGFAAPRCPRRRVAAASGLRHAALSGHSQSASTRSTSVGRWRCWGGPTTIRPRRSPCSPVAPSPPTSPPRIDRARAFYADTLSLTPSDEMYDTLVYRIDGGSTFSVYKTEFAGQAGHPIAQWHVDDVEAQARGSRRRGSRSRPMTCRASPGTTESRHGRHGQGRLVQGQRRQHPLSRLGLPQQLSDAATGRGRRASGGRSARHPGQTDPHRRPVREVPATRAVTSAGTSPASSSPTAPRAPRRCSPRPDRRSLRCP